MASVHKNRSWMILLLIVGLAVLPTVAQAQTGTGVIVGTVSGPAGGALANASVSLAGTNLAATTNQQGSFRLSPVPAGEHTIVVTYTSMGAGTATVKVTAGETVKADVRLSFSEAIEVSGSSFLQGQAKALNTQENATNITNVVSSDQMSRFPDINAAESTQRLPAVSLLRDQGEGRYVLVRGTEPRLNSTTVNGERLPSPEGGGRNVALDTIPADVLEAISVSKTLTPDMDGDSIGGTVDLVTKRAPLKASTQASIAGGWADISQDYIGAAAFTLGRRFSRGQDRIPVVPEREQVEPRLGRPGARVRRAEPDRLPAARLHAHTRALRRELLARPAAVVGVRAVPARPLGQLQGQRDPARHGQRGRGQRTAARHSGPHADLEHLLDHRRRKLRRG